LALQRRGASSGRKRKSLAVALSAAALFGASPARAFERQWHLGGQLLGVAPDASRATGAGAGVYVAYGVSDVFDVRGELRSSLHSKAGASEAFELHLGELGLAYKLDVLEWIPYFGVRAGYYFVTSDPGPWARSGGALGAFAGLDHAFSRSFAAGLEVSADRLMPDGAVSSLGLRAEYRFGY
jgi:hypothetical protein